MACFSEREGWDGEGQGLGDGDGQGRAPFLKVLKRTFPLRCWITALSSVCTQEEEEEKKRFQIEILDLTARCVVCN